MGWDKVREKSLKNYCHGQNRPNSWKLIDFQSDQNRIVRKQILKTVSLNLFFLPGLNFFLDFLLPPHSGMEGWGRGAAVPSSHVVSASPFPSWVELLSLLPYSSIGFFPWEAVLHDLLQCEYIPWAAAPHKLLHLGSLPWVTLWSLPQVAGGSALPWISIDFSMDCCGISTLVPAHSPPLSSLTLVSAGLFVSHLLTPVFAGWENLCAIIFSTSYFIQEALPP